MDANTVAIGLIDNHADPAITARLESQIPDGRLGQPEDIAAACLHLVSMEASWITGQTIELDGGQVTT